MSGQAIGGGVIPDHYEQWLCGFSWHIGVATSVMAELWALKNCLVLVVLYGILELGDKVLDLGLKEGYVVVEFGSGVEVSGGEEVLEGFGEADLLERERDSVKRDIVVVLECGFVKEVGFGWVVMMVTLWPCDAKSWAISKREIMWPSARNGRKKISRG
uniref:Uncharacterized protein n=1 Tax=Fagus sylvatica TaxID=28930 RepID=A0A2N9IYM2_FAGSY